MTLIALLFLLPAGPGRLADMVEVEPSDPPPMGTEPVLVLEEGPFSASLGGYLRARSDEGSGFDVDPLLYTRGVVLPLLGIRYDLELWLPGARERQVELRQAAVSMQLASTEALGLVRLGVLPIPFELDSERLLPDRPTLASAPVTDAFGFASQPGLRYRLDHRRSWLPLLFDLALFAVPGDMGPERPGLATRLEALLYGESRGFRSLRLGVAAGSLGRSLRRDLRLLAYAHFRHDRVLMEGEICVARLFGAIQFKSRAWHLRLGFDLIAEFLQIVAAGGDSVGVAATPGRNVTFMVTGLRMFILRRRVVVSFESQGISPRHRLRFQERLTRLAFDLRF